MKVKMESVLRERHGIRPCISLSRSIKERSGSNSREDGMGGHERPVLFGPMDQRIHQIPI